MANKYRKSSILAFYVMVLLSLIFAELIVINNIYVFYFVCAFVSIVYLLYSIIRFNHYKAYFPTFKALIYTLFDNITFLLGIIYYLIMNKNFISPTEVNFIVIIVYVVFLIPTLLGNDRLKKYDKSSGCLL